MNEAVATALHVARKPREDGGAATLDNNPLVQSAINEATAWKNAGKPDHSWISNGHLAKRASQAIGNLQDSFKSLPDGQYWRGTNDPKEASLLTPTTVSKNHITGESENGLSVSRTPASIAAYGYSHGYPVTGTVAGSGSDGEPLLRNPRAMGSVLPAKKILERDRQRVKAINDAFNHVAKKSGLDRNIIGWLGSRFSTIGKALGGATSIARQHREDGGNTNSTTHGPGIETQKVKNSFFHGPIHSHVAGRTDHLPLTVESGSYVLPADIVSAGGEGSTIAGFKVLRRTFGGTPYGQGAHPYGQKGGPYGEPLPRASGGRTKAAGILFLSPEKEVLLMRRAGKDHHGEYALPAGHIEKGETAEKAARRETQEEAGYDHDGGLSPFMHSSKDGVDFTTFVAHSEKFKPKLNDEHDDAIWVKPSEAEKLPLHPGVRSAIDKLRTGKAHGGSSSGVPIVAAGGEWVIPPHHVAQVGNGDLDMGHRVLDEFVKQVRKELIGTLQKLPGPKRD